MSSINMYSVQFVTLCTKTLFYFVSIRFSTSLQGSEKHELNRSAKNRNHTKTRSFRGMSKSEFVRGMHLNALNIFIVNYFLLPAMSKL